MNKLKNTFQACIFFFILIIYQSSSIISTAQAPDTLWLKIYPGSITGYDEALIPTLDSGYAIATTRFTWGATNKAVYVIKTDNKGDTTWTRTYDSDIYAQYIEGFDIKQLADSGYIICGDSVRFDFKGLLFHIDKDGSPLNTYSYDAPGNNILFYEMELSYDSSIVMVGYQTVDNKVNYQGCVYKTDLNGNLLNSSMFGGSWNDYIYDIKPLKNKTGFIGLGNTYTYGPGTNTYSNHYVVRMNDNLQTMWSKNFGGDKQDEASSIIETTDGGFLFCGKTSSYGISGSAAHLIKLNQNGDTLWTRVFHNNDGLDWLAAYDVIETSDTSGYVWVGNAHSDKLWIVKIDYFGDTLWSKTLDIGTNEYARKIIETSDGGYIITGGVKIGPSANPVQPFLLKLGVDTIGAEIKPIDGVLSYIDTVLIYDTIYVYDTIKVYDTIEVTAINESLELYNQQKQPYHIYPAPIINTMKLDINSGGNGLFVLQVVDLSGKVKAEYKEKLERPALYRFSFDVDMLDPGIYLCRMSFDGKTYTKQVIKQ